MENLDNWLKVENNDTHPTAGALRAALEGEEFDLNKDLSVISAELKDNRTELRNVLLGYDNVKRGKVNGLFAAADAYTKTQGMF